jgi:hypothetical protein
MLTLLAESVVCPWNQMPELTIYRQTDLESARSSAPAEQQAADVTPEPATTTDVIQLLPSLSQWLSRFWKKGPPSAATTTVRSLHPAITGPPGRSWLDNRFNAGSSCGPPCWC